MEETISKALAAYDFGGDVVGALPYGCGHINQTYAVYIQKKNGDAIRYIMQKINTGVFLKPHNLMSNIIGVTQYLKELIIQNGGDVSRETLSLLKTKEDEWYYVDEKNNFYRVYNFIENALSLQTVEDPKYFYESAVAFGNFTKQLEGYDAKNLFETIPNFHNTRNRFNNLIDSIKADTCSRVNHALREIDFAAEREGGCGIILDLLESGDIPLRVTHNDTKLNNVMIDRVTGKGICVIDLDTIMPGSILYDFGDSIRFGATSAAEDEKDLSKVNFRKDLYDICLEGYLNGLDGSVNKTETELFPYGAKLMTLECGIRFLTDYLNGDVYFKTSRKEQNLDRAKNQFKLVSDMERVLNL